MFWVVGTKVALPLAMNISRNFLFISQSFFLSMGACAIEDTSSFDSDTLADGSQVTSKIATCTLQTTETHAFAPNIDPYYGEEMSRVLASATEKLNRTNSGKCYFVPTGEDRHDPNLNDQVWFTPCVPSESQEPEIETITIGNTRSESDIFIITGTLFENTKTIRDKDGNGLADSINFHDSSVYVSEDPDDPNYDNSCRTEDTKDLSMETFTGGGMSKYYQVTTIITSSYDASGSCSVTEKFKECEDNGGEITIAN